MVVPLQDAALVRPGLYLASARAEKDAAALRSAGITHVLQVGAELRPSHPGAFAYLQLEAFDMPSQDIVGCFPKAFAFISAARAGGGGVLVHCAAGISRSASVVIGWLMADEALSAAAAASAVRAVRPIARPNPGFERQLERFGRMGCDAAVWPGWDMAAYLATQYGSDSAGFMASMLGRGEDEAAAALADARSAHTHHATTAATASKADSTELPHPRRSSGAVSAPGKRTMGGGDPSPAPLGEETALLMAG